VKRAVGISLGSSSRDKRVTVDLKGELISVERIGTDGNVDKARRLFAELDGEVDAFGVGGVDLYLRLGEREYPLRAPLKLVQDVHHTPVVDGRGLKHTLERRVFELAAPALGGVPHFRRAFVTVAADRPGLAQAAADVSAEVVIGDLMIALGIPFPIRGLNLYRRLARLFFPIVGLFPMRWLFYGSSGKEFEPKYERFFQSSDLIAGDFLFMRRHMPYEMVGKTIVTNTTTAENVEWLRERGVHMVITTTPRYDGRSFGTNTTEAMLTAYAGKGRALTDDELDALIDDLNLRPSVKNLNS
jgi:hypothetical protein